MSGQSYWRSLDSQIESPEFLERLQNEFPQGAAQLELVNAVDRRKFLGVLGASLALAGLSTTGCVRKPKQEIFPRAQRPEELVPGKALYYSTVAIIGQSVVGLVAKSFDGRPIHLEGNAFHPTSRGSLSAWGQAELLGLYDPDRLQKPRVSKKVTNWSELKGQLAQLRNKWKQSDGRGLVVAVAAQPSLTQKRLLKQVKAAFPQAQFLIEDAVQAPAISAMAKTLGLGAVRCSADFSRAKVIAVFDGDPLYSQGEVLSHSRGFAEGRTLSGPLDDMNRLYVVEPYFTVTGLAAEHRLRLPASQVGEALKTLVTILANRGAKFPQNAQGLVSSLKVDEAFVSQQGRWLGSLADDLMKNQRESLVVVGDRQPPWVHALGALVNAALGNVGVTVSYFSEDQISSDFSQKSFEDALLSGTVKGVVSLGVNPVLKAYRPKEVAAAWGQIADVVQYSYHNDESAALASCVIPATHFLESWGDLYSANGTVAVQQPLIAPLFDAPSGIELMAFLATGQWAKGYDLVRETLQGMNALDFEKSWRRSLHDGVVQGAPHSAQPVKWDSASWSAVVGSIPAFAPAEGLEINLHYSSAVYDGRYANNGWLQELPDPVTKVTWDNVAALSPKTAERLGLKNEDLVDVSSGKGVVVRLPVWVVPGTADNVVAISLGYGRAIGQVSEGAGANAYGLAGVKEDAPFIVTQGTLAKVPGTLRVACTQEHGSMEGRALVREASLVEFKRDPDFVLRGELMPPAKHKTYLWERPNGTEGHQWGMSIDLNTCIGCNACTVACQSENNIPVVGKERVLNGREMHWIRLDRYFNGNVDDPQVVSQPIPCMQCENAPCESVCPVAATVHGPEGTNDMAYNRCVGTRYCANNCPYKVRRFNFFNFAKENFDQSPLRSMQLNPNVTVRFRGVMEKCSYCVQRINEARIEAKLQTNGVIADGRIVTACQQACPTRAISFGDIADPQSKVSLAKKQSRNYVLLGELNNQPRTSYLAKIRNPNPELV